MEDKDIYKAPTKLHRQGPIKVFKKDKSYTAYIAAKKKSTNPKKPRKALIDLSINTVRKPHDSKDWVRPTRPPRTKWGCLLCKIPLCQDGPCWQEHLDQIKPLQNQIYIYIYIRPHKALLSRTTAQLYGTIRTLNVEPLIGSLTIGRVPPAHGIAEYGQLLQIAVDCGNLMISL